MSASGGAGASAGPRELGRPSPDNGYARALALNKHARENPAPVVEEPPKSPRTAALERARALPDGDRRELRPTALLRRALLAMADNDADKIEIDRANVYPLPEADLALSEHLLPGNTALTSISLRRCGVAAEGVRSLLAGLVGNATLRKLDLFGNATAGDAACAHLGDALASDDTAKALQVLDLRRCAVGDAGATALAKALHLNGSLRLLNLARNGVGRHGARELGDALRVNTALAALDLQHNALGNGVSLLAEGVEENGTLQRLDVAGNAVGNAAADALGRMLAGSCLRSFRAAGNAFLEPAAGALARGVAHAEFLVHLDLSGNFIGHRGAMALGDALPRCTTLATLNLDNCDIADEGVVAIARGIASHPTLHTLLLGYNRATDAGAEQLVELLKAGGNTALRKLWLMGQRVSDQTAAHVAVQLRGAEELGFAAVGPMKED